MAEPSAPKRVNRARFKIPSEKGTVAAPKSEAKQPDQVTAPAPAAKQKEAPAQAPKPALPEPVSAASAATPLRNLAVSTESANPLQGKIICFASDVFSIPQAEVERRVELAGGKIGSALSQRTSFLVLGGKLPDGRPARESAKYQRFLDLQRKGTVVAEVVEEEDFLKLLPKEAKHPETKGEAQNPQKQAKPTQNPFNWVDIFAPFQLNQLLGNNAVIQRLSDWLRDWEEVVLRGKKKAVSFQPGHGAPENINARAALVSGPPGVGKTTAARLVAQLHGAYEVLEYNASDARSQKVIQDMADGIAQNSAISFPGSGSKRKAVIIMDEVDGIGAGDRGGIAALIKMIKTTRNPIICICNDRQHQKVRNLASSCYDLKFSRPAKAAVAQRCADIARRQGLKVDLRSLEALAESCGCDMRVVLNQLQMSGGSLGGKDQEVMLGPFEACRKLLNASEAARTSFDERQNLFFVDYSMVGLLIQENYLRSMERKRADLQVLNRCAYSADLMTVGDIFNQRIGAAQEWGLLPHCAVVSCAYPAWVTNGVLAYPSFPAALGKMSTLSRSRRLVMELQMHLRLSATVDGKGMMTSSYGELLYRRLLEPLKKGNIKETVGLMDAYGLRREHLVEHLTELRQHVGSQDEFKQVDSKVKAALTRELNSGSHAVKVPVWQLGRFQGSLPV
ncbi:unnamed protein product [Effrenium voratum]|uniref:Replication factor C subunit 1 n=1 Tax=Effrenium voratum TaxID=2562239 RepID=A0AA36IB15_9DINO|nr:unnamed protein product [Effrenium voratum]CAJ1428249.1 unnamed protein product [Effrenium voratum]